jgi:hypothetical protein
LADVLEFEWNRLVDGYKLERLDPDLLTFVHDLEEDHWYLIRVSEDAPSWVRDLVEQDQSGGHNIKFNLDDYPNGDRYLVPLGQKTERYRPLEMYPSLFMELADTKPTPEGLTGFINKFGFPIGVRDSDEKIEIIEPWVLGLVLSEPKSINSVIRSWDRHRKTGNTQSFLRRLRGERRLRDASFNVRFKQAPEKNELSLELVPHDLLDAIWLQLAQAITKNYGYRQCDECLTWFEVAPGKGRPEKRFCSNACSMRAYRKRKAGSQ